MCVHVAPAYIGYKLFSLPILSTCCCCLLGDVVVIIEQTLAGDYFVILNKRTGQSGKVPVDYIEISEPPFPPLPSHTLLFHLPVLTLLLSFPTYLFNLSFSTLSLPSFLYPSLPFAISLPPPSLYHLPSLPPLPSPCILSHISPYPSSRSNHAVSYQSLESVASYLIHRDAVNRFLRGLTQPLHSIVVLFVHRPCSSRGRGSGPATN